MLRVERSGQFPSVLAAASVGDAFEVTVALDRLLAGPGFGGSQPSTRDEDLIDRAFQHVA